MLKVYADPCTVNCRKVLTGLDLMGVPHELVHVD
jgi:glutathione S-transferase